MRQADVTATSPPHLDRLRHKSGTGDSVVARWRGFNSQQGGVHLSADHAHRLRHEDGCTLRSEQSSMNYPLENLDPERFQHFCQALLVREHPQLQCFPVAQPDGGRDAIA